VFINNGIAFGLRQSWLVVVGIVLLVAYGGLYRFQPRWLWLVLTLSVLSNLIDRAIYGGVVDYLTFADLKFNLADLAILVAAGLLAAHALKSENKNPE
jgi:lipoprotein signal peptidase